MNKRGFTLVELLSVIVILGILCSVATMEVFRYKRFTNEKEVVNLRATIEECYDNYRNRTILSGYDYQKSLDFSGNSDIFKKYFGELSYNGNRLEFKDIEFKLDLKVKGDLIADRSTYACYNNRENVDYAKDKTCIVETKIETEVDSDGNKKLTSSCKEGFLPSKDEVLCISLKLTGDNGKVLLDDLGKFNGVSGANKENLCYYFAAGKNCE